MEIKYLTPENKFNLIELCLRLDKDDLKYIKSENEVVKLSQFRELFYLNTLYNDFNGQTSYRKIAENIHLLQIKPIQSFDDFVLKLKNQLKNARNTPKADSEEIQAQLDEIINENRFPHYQVLSKGYYSYWGMIKNRVYY
jgi:hypothetical protein